MSAPNYFSHLRNDLPAGVVVFLVAIPLCLGIALASGAPLFSGLIAGFVGGIVVGFMSGSNVGVSGPAAGLAAIVLQAINDLGAFETFLVAVIIGGALQIILGFLKAGIIAYYFPSSVIKGMLSGIGIIIILKQIPHFFGYDKDFEGDLAFSQADGQNTFSEILETLTHISLSAFFISSVSLAILILWEQPFIKKIKITQVVQGPLVAIIFGIAFQLFALNFHPDWALRADNLVRVPVPDSFSSFFGQFTLPDFRVISDSQIWIIGATIALVASLETLLCVEATDKLDPEKRVTPTNRELIAQGTGNMISGFIGGLPITQVIVRSSANIQSGGKTKVSAIFHGILILVSIALIPNILNLIPLAVLASILIMVGYKLAKPSLFISMFKLGPTQLIPFVVTILGIVFTDLLIGIGLGLVVGIFIILRNNFRNSHFLHIEEEGDSRHIRMTLSEEVTFLNKAAILRELDRLPEKVSLTIDLSKTQVMDHDVKEIIKDFKDTCDAKSIKLNLISKEKLKPNMVEV